MWQGDHLVVGEGTEEEFYAIEERKADFVRRMIVMHSPASVPHERMFLRIISTLFGYVESAGLGEVFGSRSLVKFSAEEQFEPDIMVIARSDEHLWSKGGTAFLGIPQVIVEILSKSTRDYDLTIKRAAYKHYRVPEIVFVDVQAETLMFDVVGTDGYETIVLNSGARESVVLQGFVWNVDALFGRC